MNTNYFKLFSESFSTYASYLWGEITHPHWGNYFYWLIFVSLLFWVLEIAMPWRRDQKVFRKDFFLDTFYMFFNYFLFSLIGFNAVSNVGVQLFSDAIGLVGLKNIVAIEVGNLAVWLQLFLLFLIRDFLQFNIHRLLHKVPWLWKFHQVHHSVQEMGFAAHLRFHWMESIVYRTLEYIPLAMIGFGIDDFLIVHFFTTAMGHFNHANISIPLGPLKYVFNNPQMHIWHHAKHIPSKTGVNFGLTLSIWDYVFKTDYIPNSGKDTPLGFEKVEQFPKTFWEQITWPFKK